MALVGCLAWGTGAQAQPPAEPAAKAASTARRVWFDIALQRLGDALDVYSRMTGLDVLIDGEHAQRPSNAVRGTLSAAEALEAMLAGTGMEARYANASSVVIRQAAAAPKEEGPSPEAAGLEGSGFNEGDVLHQAYAAQVQHALRGALCDTTQTRPGSYRLALQLHLDARGAVDRFRLLSTTGEPDRDAAVRFKVQRLSVGAPPPPSLPQPLVVLLLPEGPGARTDCASTRSTLP